METIITEKKMKCDNCNNYIRKPKYYKEMIGTCCFKCFNNALLALALSFSSKAAFSAASLASSAILVSFNFLRTFSCSLADILVKALVDLSCLTSNA